MKKIFTNLIVILSCCFCFIVKGGNESGVRFLKGDDIEVSNSITIRDNNYYEILGSNISGLVKNTEVRTRLHFRQSEQNHYVDNWSLKVKYNVQFVLLDGTSGLGYTDSIEIDYRTFADYNDESINVYDLSEAGLSPIIAANLVVTEVELCGIDGGVIPNDIFLDLEYHSSSCRVFPENEDLKLHHTVNTSDNTVEFGWEFFDGIEEYELQWIFVDNGSEDFSSSTGLEYDFTNATQVKLHHNTYTIPLAYPKGFLLYRLRGSGLSQDAENCEDEQTWGAFTASASTGTIGNFTSSNPNHYIEVNGLNLNTTWQYSGTFAEEGLRKDGVSYFDGSLRARQAITQLNSEELTVYTESIYDAEGRQTISTLPAVIDGSTGLQQITSPSTYTYNNFDLTGNYYNPDPLLSTHPVEQYYSSNNTLDVNNRDYIPQANGYAYNRTLFSNEGAAKPLMQGGAGQTHRIGEGHENVSVYSKPSSQVEVDRLFGIDAHPYHSYAKVIQIDPNGTQTVQYIDYKGQTVASGLVHTGASNELTGSDYNDELSSYFDNITNDDIFHTNNTNKDKIEAKFPFIFNGEATLVYAFESGVFNFTASGGNCNFTDAISPTYNYSFKLTNAHGDVLYTQDEVSIDSKQFTVDLSTLGLTVGQSYKLERTIEYQSLTNTALYELVDECLDLSYYYEPPVPVGCFEKELSYILASTYAFDYMRIGEYYEVVGETYLVDGSGNTFDGSGTSLGGVDENPALNLILVNKQTGAFVVDIDLDNIPGSFSTYFQSGTFGLIPTLRDIVCETSDLNPLSKFDENIIQDFRGGGQFVTLREPDGGASSYYPVLENAYGVASIPTGLQAVSSTVYTAILSDVLSDDPLVQSDFTQLWNDMTGGAGLTHWPTVIANWDRTFYTKAGNVIGFWTLISNYASAEEYRQTYLLDYHPEKDITYTINTDIVYREDILATKAEAFLKPSGEIDIQTVLDNDALFDGATGITDIIGDDLQSLFTYIDAKQDDASVSISSYFSNGEEVEKWLFGTGALNEEGLFAHGLKKEDLFKILYLQARDYLIFDSSDPLGIGYTYNPSALPSNFAADFPDFVFTYQTPPFYYDQYNVLFDNVNGLDLGQLAMFFENFVRSKVEEKIKTELQKLGANLVKEDLIYFNIVDINGGTTIEYDFDYSQEPAVGNVNDGVLNACSQYFGNSMEVLDAFQKEYLIHNGVSFKTGEVNINEAVHFHKFNIYDLMENSLNKDLLTGMNTSSFAFSYSPYPTSVTGTMEAWLEAEVSSILSPVSSTIELTYTMDGSGAFNYPAASSLSDNCVDDDEYQLRYKMYLTLPTDTQIENFVSYTGLNLDFAWMKVGEDTYTSSDYSYTLASVASRDELVLSNYQKAVWAILGEVIKDLDVFALNPENITETTLFTYNLKEYHYTLYYYDQTGHLIKTVPPKGVQVFNTSAQFTGVETARDNGDFTSDINRPTHGFKTDYRYNSIGQLVNQHTPDGGEMSLYYDEIGRIVLSQDARQQATNEASYSLFDVHGRVVESGKLNAITVSDLNGLTGSNLINYNTFKAFVEGEPRSEVNLTVYDELGRPDSNDNIPASVVEFNSDYDQLHSVPERFKQEYLRNRVSYTTVINSNIGGFQTLEDIDPEYTMYYNYDVHGNVKQILVRYSDLFNQYWYKTIDYTYDLISGNVLSMTYQKGETDQHIVRYFYDADNRITEVETSLDGIIWDKDAKYYYYVHGPLARVEYGKRQVQSFDYVYNINGWLKGINSGVLDETLDVGQDGVNTSSNLHGLIARDALGFVLRYHDMDYAPISSSASGFEPTALDQTLSSGNGEDLYNGNISRMVTAISNGIQNTSAIEEMTPVVYTYKYDKLNRIKQMLSYNVDETSNIVDWTNQLDWQGIYHYDPNGNITSLGRHEPNSNHLINYSYNGLNNQLNAVSSNASWGNASYTYDASGNLLTDSGPDSEIGDIDWYASGKVKKIARSASSTKPTLEFKYNSLGNRYLKEVYSSNHVFKLTNKADYSISDANGNVLANYSQWVEETEEIESDSPNLYEVYTKIDEHPIYGSSRLGVNRNSVYMQSYMLHGGIQEIDSLTNLTHQYFDEDSSEYLAYTPQWGTTYKHRLGNKRFELSNHLGNTLAVISDRKKTIGTAMPTSDVFSFTLDGNYTGGNWDVISSTSLYSVTIDEEDVDVNPNVLDSAFSINEFGVITSAGTTVSIADLPDYNASSTNTNFGASGASLPVIHLGLASSSNFVNSPKIVLPVRQNDSIWVSFDSYKGLYGLYYELVIDGEVRKLWHMDHIGMSLSPSGNSWTTNTFLFTKGLNLYDYADACATAELRISVYTRDGNPDIEKIFDKFTVNVKRRQYGLGNLSHYIADVKSATDYYPFGMQMPERKFTSADGYRYGFNGKEKDDEIKGEGNSIDFGARMYDSRLGRWFAADRAKDEYPSHSPYSYAINSPIRLIDLDGNRVYIIIYSGGEESYFHLGAMTRAREIESLEGFNSETDHVYMVSAGDLGNLGDRLNVLVDREVYGKTVELAIYSHCGIGDGPVGDEKTSKYGVDGYQLSTDGWAKIDFNFDKESLAAFYGCNSAGFAYIFARHQKAKYTAGNGSSSSFSTSKTEYDPPSDWLKLFGLDPSGNYYFVSPIEEGEDYDKAIDMTLFKREGRTYDPENPESIEYLKYPKDLLLGAEGSGTTNLNLEQVQSAKTLDDD